MHAARAAAGIADFALSIPFIVQGIRVWREYSAETMTHYVHSFQINWRSIMNAITRRLSILMLFALVGMAGMAEKAHAQIWPFWPWCPPNIITCNYLPGPIIVVRDGIEYAGTSNGQGSFLVVASAGGPGTVASVSYVPQTVSATSTFPASFGTITTSLTPNTPVVVSSTTSNVPGALYPARSEMGFYATARIGDLSYTSQDPVVLLAENANSFGPFVQEPFHLARPVVFLDANGSPNFTLVRLDVTFNN